MAGSNFGNVQKSRREPPKMIDYVGELDHCEGGGRLAPIIQS